jgi:biopolymer transport protein ExbB/TolQ
VPGAAHVLRQGRTIRPANLRKHLMQTVVEWYAGGGPVMHYVLGTAAVGLAVVLERLYVVVVRAKTNARLFIERVISLVRAGKVDEAIRVCASSRTAVADVALLLLRSRTHDEEDLNNVAHAAELSVSPRLTKRLRYLPSLAAVAVLIGTAGSLLALGDGIALATSLRPAVLGLFVAAVLILAHAYLERQAESITEQMDELSVRLINALIDAPDVRLGHR